MKIRLLSLFALSLVMASASLNALCTPGHNQSKKVCIDSALDEEKHCIAEAQEQISRLEDGPDTYMQRQHYINQMHSGCPSDRQREMRKCEQSCPQP